MKLRAVLLGFSLGLGLAIALPALAQDEVSRSAKDDPAMEAAIAEAKATLPLFLAHALDADGVSVAGALVKVVLPTGAGTGTDPEHLWVTPFARMPEGGFVGYLANAPVGLGPLRKGDRVEFSETMISDWHLTGPSGRYYGSFTSRVMHAAGAFGDKPFGQVFEPDPLPPGWH